FFFFFFIPSIFFGWTLISISAANYESDIWRPVETADVEFLPASVTTNCVVQLVSYYRRNRRLPASAY
ncbi:hypothetical protein B0H13DRAFT_2058044, partial [Mycena leptocephala]